MNTQELSLLEALRNNTPSQIPGITDTRTTEEKKLEHEIKAALGFLVSDLVKLILDYTQLFLSGQLIHRFKVDIAGDITSDGRYLYITRYAIEAPVQVYTFDGKFVETWNEKLFSCPQGIDYYNNNLYIIDTCVKIFNKNKIKLKEWAYLGQGLRIKVDYNLIYTTWSCSYHQIVIWTHDGKIFKKIGPESKGSQLEEFDYPTGLGFDENFLYVCDCNNYRIQLFDKGTFKFHSSWGSKGNTPGLFDRPTDILVMDEYCIISDYNGIQIFHKNGEFKKRIVDQESYKIRGMTIYNNCLYACNYFYGYVHVYR